MRLALILVAAAVRLAHADSPSTIASSTTESAPTHTLAFAINEPVGWNHGNAVGFSGYGAITEHQVIHLNVATWKRNGDDVGGALLFLATQGNLDGNGRYTDVGAAWMYFPRRVYNGFSVELGALVRQRDTFEYLNDFDPDGTHVTSTTLAGRALVGWSWLGWNRVFVSLQLGVSAGREGGTQTVLATQYKGTTMTETMQTSSVDRATVSPEGFVRFGVLLDP
jgi:hypothetical protein